MEINYLEYINRRDILSKKIKQKHLGKKGLILLFSAFENHRYKFRQDSTFYYFTNLKEPGIILTIDLLEPSKKQILYIPKYQESRAKWSKSILSINSSPKDLKNIGINHIEYLGNFVNGYNINPIFNNNHYENIINLLKQNPDYYIFTTYSQEYIEQYLLIKQILNFMPELEKNIVDISDIIAQMRCKKSMSEAENIYNAVGCTIAAHDMAAKIINEDKFEFEVQAGVEFIFQQSGGSAAFPSIIASGSNGLILHYNSNSSKIEKDSLVIVDIGAELDYYCADISRTYPASGQFSKKQKEFYQIVLDTQEYVKSLAKPGYWLNNKNEPNRSLHHLAHKFLEKSGYSKYFTHGIGHYLGLDVHDVGNYSEPLKEGDSFTIEPGLYIPEENIAIRIEDDYWLSEDGLICLSEELPKDPDSIEELMAQEQEWDMNNDIDDLQEE